MVREQLPPLQIPVDWGVFDTYYPFERIQAGELPDIQFNYTEVDLSLTGHEVEELRPLGVQENLLPVAHQSTTLEDDLSGDAPVLAYIELPDPSVGWRFHGWQPLENNFVAICWLSNRSEVNA